MKWRTRSVSIRQLPECVDDFQRRRIFDDLESSINVDRPAVVLDCSKLRVLDKSALHLLLCCLEEAMKRNGDVRLAALHPEPRTQLRSAGIDSLFQCFESIPEAVESYRRPDFELVPMKRLADEQSKMNAA
jgi:anti-anti-sigma regulatory factor